MKLQFKRGIATLIFFTLFFQTILMPVAFCQRHDFSPPMLRGIKVDAKDPFHFTFVMDHGEVPLSGVDVKNEGVKLIKYFLTSLTLPEDQLWVNLSPTEKDRVIPEDFGRTEMGRQLLSEDYLLKKWSASLLHPDLESGKRYWNKVRTTNIPSETMDRIWIMPDKAVVYQDTGIALIGETHLKVMMREETKSDPSSEIFRSEILPIIEKEVNEGKDFASLRQIYNSLILAAWYKQMLKESVLSKVFVDQSKVAGVESDEKDAKERIYNQYLDMFRRGVYQLIREEEDPTTGEMIPRKYFSGGVTLLVGSSNVMTNLPLSQASGFASGQYSVLDISTEGLVTKVSSAVQTVTKKITTSQGDVTVDFVIKPEFMPSPGGLDQQKNRDLLESAVQRLVDNNSISKEDILSEEKITIAQLDHTSFHDLYTLSVGGHEKDYVLKFCADARYLNDTKNEWNILTLLKLERVDPNFDIAKPIMPGPIFYIVTQYLPGVNLSDTLKKGPLDMSDVVDLGYKLAAAISYVHSKGVIVRDIQTDNIRIMPDGRIGLYDFNLSITDDYDWNIDPYNLKIISKSLNVEDRDVPLKDRLRPDAQTDIYAIGMTLLSATIKKPGNPDQFDIPAALEAVSDKRVQDIIAKAIGPRVDRYKTADELKKDFENLKDILVKETVVSSAVDIHKKREEALRKLSKLDLQDWIPQNLIKRFKEIAHDEFRVIKIATKHADLEDELTKELKEVPNNTYIALIIVDDLTGLPDGKSRIDYHIIFDNKRSLWAHRDKILAGPQLKDNQGQPYPGLHLGLFEFISSFSYFPEYDFVHRHLLSIGKHYTSKLKGQGFARDIYEAMDRNFQEIFPRSKLSVVVYSQRIQRFLKNRFKARQLSPREIKKWDIDHIIQLSPYDAKRVWAGRIRASSVVGAQKADNLGGIDLRQEHLNLDLRGQAAPFALPSEPASLHNIHIDGLIPIIDNVVPLRSLSEFIPQRNNTSVKL